MPFIKTHENLHKNVNENIHIFMPIFMNGNLAIFVRILVKFSLKCRTKNLGMIYNILEYFIFELGRGLYIRSQIRPRKIPDISHI